MQLKEGRWFAPGNTTRNVVTQYHDVILETTGSKILAYFIAVVNVIELLGLGCAQIISSSSNLYYANLGHLNSNGSPTMTKRNFAFLSGAICTCFVLIPQYR